MSDPTVIWVVGYPKSGNTWLARLLGDALNSPVTSYPSLGALMERYGYES